MSEAAGATSRLLVVADQLLEKLLDHNLQFSQQTGAGQIVDDLMTEIRRLSAELAALKAAMGEPVGFVTPETVTQLKQFDEEDWCAIWNRQTSKVTIPLYAIPKDKP